MLSYIFIRIKTKNYTSKIVFRSNVFLFNFVVQTLYMWGLVCVGVCHLCIFPAPTHLSPVITPCCQSLVFLFILCLGVFSLVRGLSFLVSCSVPVHLVIFSPHASFAGTSALLCNKYPLFNPQLPKSCLHPWSNLTPRLWQYIHKKMLSLNSLSNRTNFCFEKFNFGDKR